jgi:tetratricopeptide (TPR) repeat protein
VWAASTLAHHRYWADDEALWRRVAAVDPANPASFDWLGARALDEGRVEDAEALFRRAIDADPESPWGWRNLALLVHTRRHRPAEALPLYERALAAFEARGGADPEAVSRVRVSRAVCLAETGRRGEALDRLLEIAEAPPYPAEAARNAAVLLAGTGGREAVAVVLERAALQLQHKELPPAARTAPSRALHRACPNLVGQYRQQPRSGSHVSEDTRNSRRTYGSPLIGLRKCLWRPVGRIWIKCFGSG